MTATIRTLRIYRQLREKGWSAAYALHAAKAQAAFDSLGEDCVRIRIEADNDCNMDDLIGDCYNPRHNPNIQASKLARQEKEFEERIEREGVYGFIAEYRDPRTGEWEQADSCWGFIGERDAYESGAAYDGMSSAVEAYNKALEASRVWSVQDGRCLVKNGKRVITLNIVPSETERYAIPPHEADALTHRIADLLNTYGETDDE